MTAKNMSAKIDKIIRQIETVGGDFRSAVQACGVLIVQHAKETGDCSKALALATAVRFASDRVKLINWFGVVSPISITFTADVTKRRVGLRKATVKGYNPFNVDRARSLEYWTLGKDDDKVTEEMTTATLNTMIIRFAKRVRKEAEENGVAKNEVAAFNKKLAALEAVSAIAA